MNSPELDTELKRLKQQHPTGDHLQLLWLPGEARHNKQGHRLKGEIQSEKTIFIYVTGLKKAIAQLHHEYLEYLISQSNKPYIDIINRLLYLLREREVHKILGPNGTLDKKDPKHPVRTK